MVLWAADILRASSVCACEAARGGEGRGGRGEEQRASRATSPGAEEEQGRTACVVYATTKHVFFLRTNLEGSMSAEPATSAL